MYIDHETRHLIHFSRPLHLASQPSLAMHTYAKKTEEEETAVPCRILHTNSPRFLIFPLFFVFFFNEQQQQQWSKEKAQEYEQTENQWHQESCKKSSSLWANEDYEKGQGKGTEERKERRGTGGVVLSYSMSIREYLYHIYLGICMYSMYTDNKYNM